MLINNPLILSEEKKKVIYQDNLKPTYLVSENKSSLPNDSLNQDSSDLDDEIPF